MEQNVRSLITDDDLLKDYLSGYTKSSNGTFSKTVTGRNMSFELFIPATYTQISISSQNDKSTFARYVQLLKDFIQKNPGWTKAYFSKADGSTCRQ